MFPIFPGMTVHDSKCSEEDYSREVYHPETNEYRYTIYRCSDCLRFQHPSSFPNQDAETEMHDLRCEECELKGEFGHLRDWHKIRSKEVHGKMVYSLITGNRHVKIKSEHFFVCEKCGHEKPKARFNYAEVDKAMEERTQPTCSDCLPEVPKKIHKLKANEMKLYLAGWGYSPVKRGTAKKELQVKFRTAYRDKINANFFQKATTRDKGLKVPCQPRPLDFCNKRADGNRGK